MRRFGERLRVLRRDGGLRQIAAAEELGITAEYLRQLERGERRPSFEILWNLGSLYGASFDELFEGLGCGEEFVRPKRRRPNGPKLSPDPQWDYAQSRADWSDQEPTEDEYDRLARRMGCLTQDQLARVDFDRCTSFMLEGRLFYRLKPLTPAWARS